jgi:hypothetical protein
MIGKPGPIKVTVQELELPENDFPPRLFSCPNYSSCLSLAAALSWESFTCRGCSGSIDEAIRWRGKSASKKDALKLICEVPNPAVIHSAPAQREGKQKVSANLRSIPETSAAVKNA